MIAIIALSALLVVVGGQYQNYQNGQYQPQQQYQQQPQAYQPQNYQPQQSYQPQPPQQSYQPQQPNSAHNPAAVHYVNIGAQLQGDYKFGYDTGRGNDGQSFREETRNPDGSVSGAYGYTDANGKQRIIRYTAGKDGFKAEGEDIPKAPPAPQPVAPQPQQQYNGYQNNGYQNNGYQNGNY